jgi:hypothetical protein
MDQKKRAGHPAVKRTIHFLFVQPSEKSSDGTQTVGGCTEDQVLAFYKGFWVSKLDPRNYSIILDKGMANGAEEQVWIPT